MTMPGLLERLSSPSHLQTAWNAVRRHRGAAGVDRVSVDDYARDAAARLGTLSERLLEGRWKPSAVRRVYLPHDPKRPLSIPTVGDRVVQRALADLFTPLLDPTFSDAAWAYRRGRSVPGALAVLDGHLAAGLRFFVRTDIEKFFDRVDQERLLADLARDIEDPRVLRLVRRIVRARVLEGATAYIATEGIPQGSGLSPLLSNAYLRAFDEAVIAAGYPFIRYADDMLVLCRDEPETSDALDLLAQQAGALGLSLSARKTERGHVGEGFTFLGVRFGPEGRGPSRRSLDALHGRIEQAVEAQAESAAAAALRDVVSLWLEHYGWLRTIDLLSLPVLLGLLFAQPEVERVRQKRLAARRKKLPGTEPAWIHVALAEQWSAWDLPGPLLLDAAEAARALAKAPDGPLRDRLVGTLALAAGDGDRVLAALAERPPSGAAAALGAAGRPALAAIVRGGLFERRPGPLRPSASRPGAASPMTDAMLDALDGRFVGRDGVHALLTENERGQRDVVPIPHPLTRDRWRAHLAGTSTLLFYPIRADITVRVCALRVRLQRVAFEQGTSPASLAGQLLDASARLLRAGQRLGVPLLHEHLAVGAGRLERRIWLPFADPVPLRDARALLLRIRAEAGDIPRPILCEPIPANDRVGRGYGPSLTLPMSLAAGGRRSQFVDLAGRPIVGWERRLNDGAWWTSRQVIALVRRGPLVAAQTRAGGDRSPFRDLARVDRVFSGCAVLQKLVGKARDLGCLEGFETQTLFETLGHVPTQGREALVRIGQLVGSRSERIVDQRLARLGSHPVSCARIRQRLPVLTARVGCDCRFGGLASGAYPTPVLHTLRPSEIPAFRGGRKPIRRKKTGAATLDVSRAGRAAPPPSPPTLLARWQGLRRRLDEVRRSLADVEARIHADFDAAGSDRLPFPEGTLMRYRDERGRAHLVLELATEDVTLDLEDDK